MNDFFRLLRVFPGFILRNVLKEKRKSNPVSDIRDYIHPPTSEGLHDVRSVIIGSWARKICGFGDGI